MLFVCLFVDGFDDEYDDGDEDDKDGDQDGDEDEDYSDKNREDNEDGNNGDKDDEDGDDDGDKDGEDDEEGDEDDEDSIYYHPQCLQYLGLFKFPFCLLFVQAYLILKGVILSFIKQLCSLFHIKKKKMKGKAEGEISGKKKTKT